MTVPRLIPAALKKRGLIPVKAANMKQQISTINRTCNTTLSPVVTVVRRWLRILSPMWLKWQKGEHCVDGLLLHLTKNVHELKTLMVIGFFLTMFITTFGTKGKKTKSSVSSNNYSKVHKVGFFSSFVTDFKESFDVTEFRRDLPSSSTFGKQFMARESIQDWS